MVLTLIFVGAAGVFGALGRRAGPPAGGEPAGAGAAAFVARCGACHDAAAIASSIGGASDREAKLSALEALLASGHGDATADENRAILAYLKERARR
jgi:hypothetical protein